MKSFTFVRTKKCTLSFHPRTSSNSIKSQVRFASTTLSKLQKDVKSLDALAAKLNINNLDDWYKVDPNIVGLRQVSLAKILAVKYPEHNWLPWKFEHSTVPKGYWMNQVNHRLYFDWAAKELGLQSQEDWYFVEAQKFGALKSGSTMLTHYGGSLSKALKTVYPDYDWKLDKFGSKPSGWWFEISNQKLFVEQAAQKLGVQTLDDWYKVGVAKFQNIGGGRLLNLYKCSLQQLLSALYPQHNWVPWKFARSPSGYWDNKDHVRLYFDELGRELGIQKLEDWYQVRYYQLFKLKKHLILTQKFNNSLYTALCYAYPEIHWIPWYFEKAPKFKAWNDPKLLKQLVYEAAEKLHIVVLDDWYRVSRKQLEDLKMRALLDHYGGLHTVLRLAYPQHSWDLQRLGKSYIKKSSQRWLALMTAELFPGQEIIEDYMHSEMLFASRRKMQLDVFVPAYSLALEFHGLQHYQDIGFFSPQARYQQRDAEKKAACIARNLTLVEIPFWWDRSAASLGATIKAIRPDIPLPNLGSAHPIPTEFTGQTSAVVTNYKTKTEAAV